MTFYQYIDGEPVVGASSIEVINPATGKVLALCPRADQHQLERAIASAKRAFPAWSRTSQEERGALLRRIADDVESELPDLARLLTQEQGKPLAQAQEEIGGVAYLLRYMAGLALGEKILVDDDTQRITRHYTPLGVVAAIAPWNFPAFIIAAKFSAALIVGNTCVAKPAPTTPLATLRIAGICNRHLPPGVLNVIVDNNDLGSALTSHPDVAKVSFTGSTGTGKKIVASTAPTLKRLTLELGGNDGAIVLDDADPTLVAPQVFRGAMVNSGQVCVAVKRLYVPNAQYEEYCERLSQLATAAIVGDGLDERTEYGPLQNRAQFDRVRSLVDDSARFGRVLCGGVVDQGDGYFVRPAIVRDLDDSARLVAEEQFGPVLPVLRYSSLEDAIRRCNDTRYGLAGSVWTSDPRRGRDVARHIDSGLVWINNHMTQDFRVPFGGAKESGIGVEFGEEGLAAFAQAHIIHELKQ